MSREVLFSELNLVAEMLQKFGGFLKNLLVDGDNHAVVIYMRAGDVAEAETLERIVRTILSDEILRRYRLPPLEIRRNDTIVEVRVPTI